MNLILSEHAVPKSYQEVFYVLSIAGFVNPHSVLPFTLPTDTPVYFDDELMDDDEQFVWHIIDHINYLVDEGYMPFKLYSEPYILFIKIPNGKYIDRNKFCHNMDMNPLALHSLF